MTEIAKSAGKGRGKVDLEDKKQGFFLENPLFLQKTIRPVR